MWKKRMDALQAIIRKYIGRILYYAGVLVVLVAVAVAAERYREAGAGELILPEANIEELVQAAAADPRPVLPEGMELIRGFGALPEWNTELGQWECHEAADYRIGGGGVPCLLAGIVETVGESGVYGGFVEIRSGDRLLRYASIAPDEALTVGHEVEAGQILGTVENGMPGEQELGSHLHLEVYVGEKATDFESLYGKMGG